MKRRGSLKIIAGISLCSFLITVVGITGSSFMESKYENDKDIYGEQILITSFLDDNEQREIENNSFWKHYGFVTNTGAINPLVGNSEITVGYMDDNALSLSRINLTEGRMPMQKGEIAVETSLSRRLALGQDIEIGSQISLEIHPLHLLYPMMDSSDEETVTKSYTVVGIIEEYIIDWHDALRSYNNNSDPTGPVYYPISVFMSRDDAAEVTASGTNCFLYSENKDMKAVRDNLPEDICYAVNNNVYARDLNNGSVDVTWDQTKLLTSVIVALLLFAMILFICSMFLVSVDSRRREFALLRTIGATKLQTIIFVLTEGAIIAVTASVIGTLFGFAASAGAVKLFKDIIMPTITFPIKLNIDLRIPLAAIALCLVSTLVSVLLPAIKASFTPPVENTSFGRHKKHGKKNAGNVGDDKLNSTFFIKNSLSGSKIRVMIYIMSLVVCIGIINLVSFYVNIMISNENTRKSSDFFLSSYGFSWSSFEIGDISADTEIGSGLVDEISAVSEVFSVRTGIFAIVHTCIDNSMMSEYIRRSGCFDEPNPDRLSFHPEIRIYDNAGLNELKSKIIEGSINMDALQSGQEVILCLPSYWLRPDAYYKGYKSYDYLNEVRPDGAEHYENTTIKTGDLLILETNPGNPAISETLTVRVGAIVDTEYAMDIITVDGALDVLDIPYFIQGIRVYMEEGADLERAESTLQNIASDNKTTFFSYAANAEKIYNNITFYKYGGGILSVMLAFIGFAIYLYTTVIRFQSRRREMSMLRTIGMTSQQCMKIFNGEGLFYGLLTGIISLASVLAVAVCFEPYRWHYYLSVPLLAISVITGIAISVVIPYYCGRQSLKNTQIIYNIYD